AAQQHHLVMEIQQLVAAQAGQCRLANGHVVCLLPVPRTGSAPLAALLYSHTCRFSALPLRSRSN
ncbi:MAG TPA: hypothetical protein VE258_04210, partial [Ktedonobacterales bacterium]|nr:hypothetical protein [Ktedonobacterales bacterium]